MTRLLPVLMGFALLLLSSTEGWSADYKKGSDAYNKKDFATALREWEPLAEQGNADAQHNLGVMYYKGQGVIQDYKTAVKWTRLAAEQGNADAQYNLGLVYENGKGVSQDNLYAHMWMNIAASQGNKDASKNRDIVAQEMTSSQIAKAQKLARKCVRKKYKGC